MAEWIHRRVISVLEDWMEKFPQNTVVKTSTSYAGGTGLILCQGAKISQASGSKTQNIKPEAIL